MPSGLTITFQTYDERIRALIDTLHLDRMPYPTIMTSEGTKVTLMAVDDDRRYLVVFPLLRGITTWVVVRGDEVRNIFRRMGRIL